MGIIADFFIATPADALAYEASLSNRAASIEKYQPAEYRNLTGLEFGILWAMLEEEQWSIDKHSLVQVHFGDDGETWLMLFPEPLVSVLAAIDDSQLPDIAKRWSEIEELSFWTPKDTLDVLKDVRGLALRSQETGTGLYLWGSL